MHAGNCRHVTLDGRRFLSRRYAIVNERTNRLRVRWQIPLATSKRPTSEEFP
jgi:hypothetical protein